MTAKRNSIFTSAFHWLFVIVAVFAIGGLLLENVHKLAEVGSNHHDSHGDHHHEESSHANSDHECCMPAVANTASSAWVNLLEIEYSYAIARPSVILENWIVSVSNKSPPLSSESMEFVI